MKPIVFVSLLILACGTPAPTPPAPLAPPTPSAAAAEAPDYPPADAAWAAVKVAEAGRSEGAGMPPTFRNAGGEIACPVMGMAIKTPADAVSFTDYAGVRYYFCCDSCEKLFLDDPDAYANGKYLKDHDLDPSAACEELPAKG